MSGLATKYLARIGVLAIGAGILLTPVSLLATHIPFTGSLTWTEIDTAATTSADTFVFIFSTGAGLTITQIAFTLGDGVSGSTLFWDVGAGGNGFGNSGAFSRSISSGTSTVVTAPTEPAAGGANPSGRSGLITFTGFNTGVTFTMFGDVDMEKPAGQVSGGACVSCDNPTGAGFVAGGALSFTVWLASTDATLLVNPTAFTFSNPASWTAGTNTAPLSWGGTTDTFLVPEPASITLLGIGLLGGYFTRRRLARKP